MEGLTVVFIPDDWRKPEYKDGPWETFQAAEQRQNHQDQHAQILCTHEETGAREEFQQKLKCRTQEIQRKNNAETNKQQEQQPHNKSTVIDQANTWQQKALHRKKGQE